jgi:diguanylate cyclase (GGDEF)-like protein
MIFSAITLVLLAGMFLLKLSASEVIVITGIWVTGSSIVRLLGGRLERLSVRSAVGKPDRAPVTDESLGSQIQELPDVRTHAHRKYFEITSRLIRIYNEDSLFETFVSSLSKLFRADFCYVLLPKAKSSELQLRYKCGADLTELTQRVVDSKSAVFDLLIRRPGAYTVDELLELTGNNMELVSLREQGTVLLAPISLPEKRLGLLGISARSGGHSPYSIEEREMTLTLCQTIEVILESIHQFRRIEELSNTDSMTHLYNYRYFYKRLNEEILRAERFRRYLALAIFDVDDFKAFNDSCGHQTGDQILRQLGSLLLQSVRSIDIVCRYGGEEFCVIMPESDQSSCVQFMERLRLKVGGHRFRSSFSNGIHTITLSAGGAIFPCDADRCDRLIYCADMALLESKKGGRNKCSMYTQLIAGNKLS